MTEMRLADTRASSPTGALRFSPEEDGAVPFEDVEVDEDFNFSDPALIEPFDAAAGLGAAAEVEAGAAAEAGLGAGRA